MPEKPTLLILVQGGAITEVYCEAPINVVVLDSDWSNTCQPVNLEWFGSVYATKLAVGHDPALIQSTLKQLAQKPK